MFNKIKLLFILFLLTVAHTHNVAYAENTTDNEPAYTQLRTVDKGTFNEYRYRITEEYFNLRNKYELDGTIDEASAKAILDYAKKGYNYLPDSLSNKNYYNYLKSAVERGILYPKNTTNYSSIVTAVENYLDKTNIQSIKGTVEAFPNTGNAPMTVTLRGSVADPYGTKIPNYNYTWWIYDNGRRVVLGNGISLNHVFKEEGKYSVYLDVVSSHKNEAGYTDVLPFSSRADITVKEKVASLIIKINSINLLSNDEIKFTPDEAKYGLVFDATSSTPTGGAKFTKTTWDFGNGVTRDNVGDPKIERVIYSKEGTYTVKLTLQTNELKKVEKTFSINIHNPIATIKSSLEEGFMGDKFTFSAQNNTNDKNLSFSWEIIDLTKDEVIFRKVGNLFTYVFNEKGKFNVKLQATDAAGGLDNDTKIIYINSRAPIADFTTSVPQLNKPNRIFFDATKSYDPDYSDDGKLKYSWIIDGQRLELDEPNFNGSTGYYTFNSVGDHSVSLEVEDPDAIISAKNLKVKINSLLSVEFFAFPRVAQRTNNVKFVSEAPEAKFYEWDFGDGEKIGGKDANVSHKFEQSGIFPVKLKVIDSVDNQNTFIKNIYVGDSDSPYSFISVLDGNKNNLSFDETACGGEGAYEVNRVDNVTFSGKESIDITGKNTGLTYSWKIGNENFNNSPEFTKKFDELGCFVVKLSVKSNTNGKTHASFVNVVVKNLKPTLSSIDVRMVDENSDPVIVNVSALGAKDLDGVIQSYLWYYYTDIDPEPQDYRATKTPQTSFVLPKVNGNYYFVVVMKDNNEDRITSDEITGSKYFIMLQGDNVNTPLVKLNVDDSTVSIGDEVNFSAKVENILGQDLTNKVSYSWDFDGDGFYDKETNLGNVTYKFTSSGEKHAKVKVKYKGFSSTKSLTVNVSNVLKPDFGYISIGNKYIFFDTSKGKADSFDWDLGDGTNVKNLSNFIHEYKDNETTHLVTLKISEGTKIKDVKKKIVKNVKNVIDARKDGLVIFSKPEINDKNEIILEDSTENVNIYLGESKGDGISYVIDEDLEYDSDLNGGNDDDEDNIKSDSYKLGGVIVVNLNDKKYQKIRLFIKGSDGKVIDSKDITIVKSYIEEKEIDLNAVIFKGVSDSIKVKIEKLKEMVSNLPKEHKLKAMMYVQKLQEEWNDNREKTNVILEFEGYIQETGVTNSEDFVNLLESLLVEEQDDKSEKAITFNALKNLIPVEIVCLDEKTQKTSKCYDVLVSKLEAIRDNQNIDENKVLGSEILKIIASDSIMTAKEKTDFKAILKTLVYGGLSNIPTDEVNDVKNDNQNTTETGSFMNLLFNVLKWLFYVIIGFLGIIGIYFAYYLIVNKDKNLKFQDFIIERTSGVKKTPVSSKKEEKLKDVLGDIGKIEKKEVKEEIVKEEVKKDLKQEGVPDWLKGSFDEEVKEVVKKEPVKEEIKKVDVKKEEVKKEEVKKEVKQDSVPSWLKGSFSEETKKQEVKAEPVKEETNVEVKQDKVPDWLKGSFTEEETKTEEVKAEPVKEETKAEVKQDNVPDWLKGSFSEEETKTEEVKTEPVKEETNVEIKQDNVPDWLKGSFTEEETKTEEVKTEPVKEETKAEVKQDKVPDWLKGSFTEEETKTEEVKTENDEDEILEEDNEDVVEEETKEGTNWQKGTFDFEDKTTKKSNKSKSKKKTNVGKTKKTETILDLDINNVGATIDDNSNIELWDDGMTVPDWLKTDTDKKSSDDNK